MAQGVEGHRVPQLLKTPDVVTLNAACVEPIELIESGNQPAWNHAAVVELRLASVTTAQSAVLVRDRLGELATARSGLRVAAEELAADFASGPNRACRLLPDDPGAEAGVGLPGGISSESTSLLYVADTVRLDADGEPAQ